MTSHHLSCAFMKTLLFVFPYVGCVKIGSVDWAHLIAGLYLCRRHFFIVSSLYLELKDMNLYIWLLPVIHRNPSL